MTAIFGKLMKSQSNDMLSQHTGKSFEQKSVETRKPLATIGIEGNIGYRGEDTAPYSLFCI